MSKVCSECSFANAPEAKRCRACKFPFSGEWPSLVKRTVGNYQLVRRVGGGGFGAVYEARHVTLGNAFAVKLLHPRLAKEEQFLERFQQEAYVMAELRHENVVQVIDFGNALEIGSYLITEWLEGRPLYKILRQTPRPPRGAILALFSQLLDALQYAHDRGIVHRDLKPENLLLTTGSRSRMLLKIVDFGIAKIVGQSYQTKLGDPASTPNFRSTLTETSDGDGDIFNRAGAAIGTPFYMSPEQVRGEMDRIDQRTDLYACGVILTEMLTGFRPFEGSSHQETMRLHLDAIPPKLRTLREDGDFSEDFESFIAKALAKEPSQRFQTAQEMYQALRKIMVLEGVEPIWEDVFRDQEASPSAPPVRPKVEYVRLPSPPPASNRRLFAVLALLILGLVGLVFALQWKPSLSPRPPARRALWISPPTSDAGASSPSAVTPDSSALSSLSPDGSPRSSPPDTARSPETGPSSEGEPLEGGGTSETPASTEVPSGDAATPEEAATDEKMNGGRAKRPKRRTARPGFRRPTKKRPAPPPIERRSLPETRQLPERRPLPLSLPKHAFRLASTPLGAEVLIRGKKKGVTPLVILGEEGEVLQITIQKKGFVARTITWKATAPRQESITLIEEL